MNSGRTAGSIEGIGKREIRNGEEVEVLVLEQSDGILLVEVLVGSLQRFSISSASTKGESMMYLGCERSHPHRGERAFLRGEEGSGSAEKSDELRTMTG